MVRILLADDHDVVRRGLREQLTQQRVRRLVVRRGQVAFHQPEMEIEIVGLVEQGLLISRQSGLESLLILQRESECKAAWPGIEDDCGKRM